MEPSDLKAIQALEETEGRIATELMRTPLGQQLVAVREIRQKLMTVLGVSSTQMPERTAATPPTATPAQPGGTARAIRPGSIASQVSGTAIELCQRTGRRFTSREIVETLQGQGVTLDPKKPQAQVASILSHHPMFNNKGDSHGKGYGLVQWTEEAEKAAGGGPIGPNGSREPQKDAAAPVDGAAA